MKRRSFFASLAGIPFLGKLLPPQEKRCVCADPRGHRFVNRDAFLCPRHGVVMMFQLYAGSEPGWKQKSVVIGTATRDVQAGEFVEIDVL